MKAADGGDSLSEDDRRALRGSRFAPLPSPAPPSFRSQPRLAHPGGPMTTNKAAALAKFLQRKMDQPGGLDSIHPEVLEMAVKNAKEAVRASDEGASSSGRLIRHVDSFGDSSDDLEDEHKVKKKKKKKKKAHQDFEDEHEVNKKKKNKKKVVGKKGKKRKHDAISKKEE